MKNKELLLDNGKIRRCPRNFAILGFWKTYWLFFGYKKALCEYDVKEIFDALWLIFNSIVYTILFPIIPFLHAFTCWRSAIREIKQRDSLRVI